MYTYVKAVCLSRSIGSQWEVIDIKDKMVASIYETYTQIFLELSNPVLTSNVFIDFNSLRHEFSNSNLTLEGLLNFLADRTLETVSALPTTEVKFAKYSDAIRAEYKVQPCRAGYVTPDNYPNDDLDDLKVSRPKYLTNITKLHSHCLLSVNGYYHWTETDNNYAYVINGAKTMRKSKINHLGILSFLDVGRLIKIKLDPTKILGANGTEPLKNKIFFTIDENIDNKSVFLVLGGYIVFQEPGVFYQTGDKTFTLDISRIPYLERLYESKPYIDLSSLNLTPDEINPDLININEAKSDATLKAYMTLSQSFLVIVDIPRLSLNKINIKHCNLPGMFTCYQDPVYPLIVNYGKSVEYWKTFEDGYWAVNVQDSFMRNYVLSEQSETYLTNVNSNLVPNKPYINSRGYLLEIAGYKL